MEAKIYPVPTPAKHTPVKSRSVNGSEKSMAQLFASPGASSPTTSQGIYIWISSPADKHKVVQEIYEATIGARGLRDMSFKGSWHDVSVKIHDKISLFSQRLHTEVIAGHNRPIGVYIGSTARKFSTRTSEHAVCFEPETNRKLSAWSKFVSGENKGKKRCMKDSHRAEVHNLLSDVPKEYLVGFEGFLQRAVVSAIDQKRYIQSKTFDTWVKDIDTRATSLAEERRRGPTETHETSTGIQFLNAKIEDTFVKGTVQGDEFVDKMRLQASMQNSFRGFFQQPPRMLMQGSAASAPEKQENKQPKRPRLSSETSNSGE